ncbi:helix-turn-helix transcriptional regulator [Psychromonas sp. Urea-02u-13]|uniref:helix-turn-helix transcriptional regulator n=1 Tax=Psychromonas sp. Urea-02u-13 TaxID=2058326 RepID=UPI000C33E975|nr:WYL domain-containing protein [Psychromonas sp. Urea-02u-13]PKG38325.1 WYL domain-containing protein [Psychromonas sp. Urea-02u-13]
MQVAQRHKHILHFIPEAPKSISAKALRVKYQEDAGDITLRMLQRDLNELYDTESNMIKEKVGQGLFWSFEPGTKTSQLMTPSLALAFNMFAEYAQHLLPSSVNKQLQGQFNQAQRALTDPKLALWQSKIATAPPGFQLHKAEIDEAILNTIEQAIIDQAQLKIVYRNRPKNFVHHAAKERLINPLGLVIRGNVYYLIAHTPENQERAFVVHRMSSAERSYNEVVFPTDFNLQAFMKKGGGVFPTDEYVDLELKVDRNRGHHLLETPLCPNQTVSEFDEQYFIIKANLPVNHELHWWLMSMADFTEVIAPQSVKKKVIEHLKDAMSMYHL